MVFVIAFEFECVFGYAQLKKEATNPDVVQPGSGRVTDNGDGLKIRRNTGDVHNNNNAKGECFAKFFILQGRGQVVSFGSLAGGKMEIGGHMEWN